VRQKVRAERLWRTTLPPQTGMGSRDFSTSATTMIYAHVVNRGPAGVRSPVDGL
jgi:hypothetical protein